MQKKAGLRRELFEDIQDRLTLDAFVGAREDEQQRQADNFNCYVRERNRLVKEKQKQASSNLTDSFILALKFFSDFFKN